MSDDAGKLAGSSDGVNADHVRVEHGVDGTGITVAVIDSGCFPDHIAFLGDHGNTRVLQGKNFNGNGSASTADMLGHGTAISGIIAGNDIAPIIAPGAQICRSRSSLTTAKTNCRPCSTPCLGS